MLGHLIYNYQHLDDVRIQQEISKGLYAPHFDGNYLVHAYNGKPEFGYKKYLEDRLIRIPNRGHYRGAVELINAGLAVFLEMRRGPRYVLVTAADTWVLNVDFFAGLVREMEQGGKVLAASSWGRAVSPEKPSGFSTDFFLLDLEWNRKAKVFPLDYDAFVKKFSDVFALQFVQPTVEGAVLYKFQKYFLDHFEDNDVWQERNKAFRRIIEREPVHGPKGDRQENWPEIGLYTSPAPEEKRKALKKLKLDLGPQMHRLLTERDVSYYNKIGGR
ncbi:MAG TPA: hypothetical protein VJB99_00485 [Patescibacteria group bacterium]|nr:hypothetical protein [Patescibacteria group bacterium]